MNQECRLDKWLWHARFTRTRTQASRLVIEGNFRVNGRKTDKAHHLVRPGDVLTFATNGRIRVIRVLGSTQRRLGFELAKSLYEDLGAD